MNRCSIPSLDVIKVPALDSGSGLFLVDRSMGEVVLLLGASLRVSAGWSEICCSDVDNTTAASAATAASVPLDNHPDVGSSWTAAALLISAWCN